MMGITNTTLEVTDRDRADSAEQPTYHIPSPLDGGFTTLCGWVDVTHEIHDWKNSRVNCLSCMDALTRIRAMKFPRNYLPKEEK